MSALEQVLEHISETSPLQKRRLDALFQNCSPDFRSEAEEFAERYAGYLRARDLPLTYAADSYVRMCNDMLRCQIDFMRTGKYPASVDTVKNDVYDNIETMTSYMVGLAISQFLWPTHYAMYKVLCSCFEKFDGRVKNYLEIGPGHGLFLNRAIDYLPSNARVVALDISQTSLSISKSILHHFRGMGESVDFVVCDVREYQSDVSFDFITMGEVLEHVPDPVNVLAKLGGLLADGGQAFISSCANAPAIDHLYHFESADEISKMIRSAGFAIEEEAVLPVEDLPMEEIIARKVTVNYCAIVRKI